MNLDQNDGLYIRQPNTIIFNCKTNQNGEKPFVRVDHFNFSAKQWANRTNWHYPAVICGKRKADFEYGF